MINQITQGDCLDVMHRIPDGSIDMVLADLPYGTTRNKWDEAIPFAALWEHYRRVVKPSGAIVLFGQGLFTARILLSNEADYRYSLVWEKGRVSGHLNAKKMPLRSHEDIAVFYRELPTYNPQMWEGKPNNGRGSASKSKSSNYGAYSGTTPVDGSTAKYPRSVVSFPKPHPAIHPTQKPVELCEWLIRTYTDAGQVVLDNCIGSGTTAIAAVQTGRRFIGIELRPEYVELSRARLAAHAQQLPLFM